ncbi:MAG: 5'/3'-nucleotidase SurE [Thermoproteota archaeon]|nr:MAG: 5'/3'-nucleotidase SurE [Candidatus Korarchaeota archaeon]
MDGLILLINDDGIGSIGLKTAWKHLKEVGEVVVIAPEEHMSGAGKSISVGKKLRVKEHRDGEMLAYSVSGTPADCILLGLFKLIRRRPDIVVSGINIGPNLGLDDFFSSGTIGAALEAAIHGIKSVSASYCTLSLKPEGLTDELDRAGIILKELVDTLLRKGFPGGVDIFSINFPERFKGPIRLTKLARSSYPDVFNEISPKTYVWRPWRMELYQSRERTDDVSAVMEGIVSLTPISLEGFSSTLLDQSRWVVEELNKRAGFL